MELNLVTMHISKVFFCFFRGARTQPLIVLYFPRFDILCAAFPFLVFRNTVERFLFFAFAYLLRKEEKNIVNNLSKTKMISLQFDVMKGLGLKLRSMKTATKSYSHTKQQIHHKVQERNNALQRVKVWHNRHKHQRSTTMAWCPGIKQAEHTEASSVSHFFWYWGRPN